MHLEQKQPAPCTSRNRDWEGAREDPGAASPGANRSPPRRRTSIDRQSRSTSLLCWRAPERPGRRESRFVVLGRLAIQSLDGSGAWQSNEIVRRSAAAFHSILQPHANARAGRIHCRAHRQDAGPERKLRTLLGRRTLSAASYQEKDAQRSNQPHRSCRSTPVRPCSP